MDTGKAEGEDIPMKKVLGEENPADCMTKGLSRRKIDQFMETMNQEAREGRAEKGLNVKEDGGARALNRKQKRLEPEAARSTVARKGAQASKIYPGIVDYAKGIGHEETEDQKELDRGHKNLKCIKKAMGN